MKDRLYMVALVVALATGCGEGSQHGYGDFLIGADAASDPSAPGAAHLYFGSAMTSDPRWTGATPALRCDLTGPDGEGAHFGNAVSTRPLSTPSDRPRAGLRRCSGTPCPRRG